MSQICYFVDESGDTTLFSRHGKALVGTQYTSRFFITGSLEVDDPPVLEAALNSLRLDLLADPLLKDVPSMQAVAGKTACLFHAKDDIPEVRHAVFSLLLKHDLHFSAVVRDKHQLLADVMLRQLTQPGYRYKPDGHELYDELIAKLFAKFGNFGVDRQITFAVRGNKPRTAVLKKVLDSIEQDFHSVFGFCPHGHTTVQSSIPSKSAGLQACDYLLWALQRFYERREERYLHALWPKFRRVLDLDAQEIKPKGLRHQEGVEFNEKHPLTLLNRAGV
ncbi:MAG: hypothetical protein EBY22_16775 [Gammaproteobacteria bacterium]|nr:hypothetical protein [Gammaproteobacteria bacterium]